MIDCVSARESGNCCLHFCAPGVPQECMSGWVGGFGAVKSSAPLYVELRRVRGPGCLFAGSCGGSSGIYVQFVGLLVLQGPPPHTTHVFFLYHGGGTCRF
ncbi:unnamed protein product [Ectocarpus sp. 8 AP-2014]